VRGNAVRGVGRLARVAFWAAAAGLGVTAGGLLRQTFEISRQPLLGPTEGPHDLPVLWGRYDASPWWGLGTVAFGLVTAAVYGWPRRHRSNATSVVIGAAVGLLALALGIAAYAPCATRWSAVYQLPGWVIALFVGGYEFDGPGAVCALRFAPGLELARTLGVSFTGVAGVLVLLRLARQQVERLVIRLSGSIDAVIGLNDESLPLVRALVRENQERHFNEAWVDRTPGWLRDTAEKVDKLLRVQPGLPETDVVPNADGPTLAVPPAYRRWFLTGLRPGDLLRFRPRRRLTVVIDSNDTNPRLSEARQAGAIVIIGDPTDPELLRLAAVVRRFGKRRVAFHRIFAVSVNQSVNLEVDATLTELLDALEVMQRRDLDLPRLFVRMDDERRAQLWRLRRMQSLGAGHANHDTPEAHVFAWDRPAQLIRDAVTSDGLAAIELVERLIPPEDWEFTPLATPTHLALVGDGPLPLAVLDELAWQVWTRVEVAQSALRKARETLAHAQRNRAAATPSEQAHLAEDQVAEASAAVEVAAERVARLSQPRLQEVVLFGDTADARLAEWSTLRGISGHGPTGTTPLAVRAAGPATDAALLTFAKEHQDCRIIFADSSLEADTMGSRLARILEADHRSERVIAVRSESTRTSSEVAGDVIRVPKGLVLHSEVSDLPPTDSMSGHARQQHRTYLGSWTEVPQPRQDLRGPRLTNVSWPALAHFFQEDNVRQYWEILSWYTRSGHTWEWVRPEPLPPIDEDLLLLATEAEYKRWRGNRIDNGWWACPSSNRHDSFRLHPDLADWTRVDQQYNVMLARWIVRRMATLGLAPTRSGVPTRPVVNAMDTDVTDPSH
jgi:hypothetical protein